MGGEKKKIKLSFFAGPHFSPHLITYVKIRLSYFWASTGTPIVFWLIAYLHILIHHWETSRTYFGKNAKHFSVPLNKCHILEEGNARYLFSVPFILKSNCLHPLTVRDVIPLRKFVSRSLMGFRHKSYVGTNFQRVKW